MELLAEDPGYVLTPGMSKSFRFWKCFVSHQSCLSPVTHTPYPYLRTIISLYLADNRTWSHAEMLHHRQSDDKFLSIPETVPVSFQS